MKTTSKDSALNLSQQSMLFNPLFQKPVTVIGAGSVGSLVVSSLAKLGILDITVWDEDSVESHNIPMSAFGLRDLGKYKVLAVQELVWQQSGIEINAVRRYYGGEPLRNSVVACVDTMEARGVIWKEVRDNPLVDIFIDTRVAEELVFVFAISPCDPEDKHYYECFMYPTEETVMQTCGNHGIIFVSSVAASAACANLTNWWQNRRKNRHFKILARELDIVLKK